MRLFGLDIRKASPDISTAIQLKPNDGQGPYTSYFRNFIARKIEPTFYEFLREALPIIDAAINRLVSLDGHIIVKGYNDLLVDEIKEWVYNVPVNDIQKGMQTFHQNITNEAFEQGFGLGEFVVDKKRTDIIGLKVADSKWVKFKRSGTSVDIYQKSDTDIEERLLNPNNLLYFSINNENQNPYGIPLMRSCEFISKILATMHNSLLNVWERFGDPSYHIHYTSSGSGATANLEERRLKIQTDFNEIINKKREGKSSDLITAGSKDSTVTITIIGSDGQLLEFEVPGRHVVEQIVAKTGLPPWMLGLHWSTTERIGDSEAEMLLADVTTRQSAKMPLFYNLVRTLLLLRGRTWQKGDWWLEWAQVNLKDIVKQAQARFLNAQADMYYLMNASSAGITIDINDLAIGKSAHSSESGVRSSEFRVRSLESEKPYPHEHACRLHDPKKEFRRPTPWPELDQVEEDYEKELKFEWNELKGKIFLIMKLNVAAPTFSGREGRNLKVAATKDDLPPIESFTFSDEQRAMVMQQLKNWTGVFDPKDENSAVRWYYGQAYSLGLIQAAKLIGKERPILDIIKNTEIYDELCKNGFQLVKDNATKAILQQIMPAMEAHMIAGSNPVQVASVLEKLFGDQNSDWERLARTEMSSAAERAKLDEWKEWDVEKVEFVPAPDACPICLALAGVYNVGDCPIPGTDTHPRCRCSIRPAESEIA